MHVRRYDIVLEMFRKFMLTWQFNNEPIRLFLACLASGLPQADQFVTTTFQKFMLREMRTHAAAVEGNVYWAPQMRRYTIHTSATEKEADDAEADGDLGAGDGDKGAPPRPTKNNPMISTVYGQSLCMAKSFQSAICRAPSFISVLMCEILSQTPQFICFMLMTTIPTILSYA